MPPQVFISYSSADKNIADAVCAGLERARLRCWIAPRDIIAGDVYGEAILDAISACKIMVVIFSSRANLSGQVLREVERAVDAGKVIVPFRIEDVKPSRAMEFFLSASHWLDAFSPPIERHIATLSTQLHALLQRPPPTEGGATTFSSAPRQAASTLNPREKRRFRLLSYALMILLISAGIGFTFYAYSRYNHPQYHIEKVSGEGQVIPSNGFREFSVRVLDSQRRPASGAKILWQTPIGGGRAYVSGTDEQGLTSASNLYSFPTPGTYFQYASLVAPTTPIGFFEESASIPTAGPVARFSFVVQNTQ